MVINKIGIVTEDINQDKIGEVKVLGKRWSAYSNTELKKDVLDVGKKTFINGKEGKVISSEPLLGKYKVLIDDEIIEIDINDSKK